MRSGLKRLRRVQMLDLISNEFFSPSVTKLKGSPNKVQPCCAICLELFTGKTSWNTIIQLNCDEGHLFHLRCFESWAARSQNCPLCRKDMIDEENLQEFVYPDSKTIYDKQDLKQLDLVPKNLYNLSIPEQSQILHAFNLSYIAITPQQRELAHMFDSKFTYSNSPEINESISNLDMSLSQNLALL